MLADKDSLEPGHLNKSASKYRHVQYVSLYRGPEAFYAVTNYIVYSATLTLLHWLISKSNIVGRTTITPTCHSFPEKSFSIRVLYQNKCIMQ